ncbi:hypothetical protein SAMN05444123_11063 [Rhodopseudomonas pseudopalustris]|uniref:Uncharacterized protein n=1 Tax=Rhodopseudomonas pseudopalustris TaxID=1513892 RepID=A0A1H8VZB7_9BRAD|nr:hypothetical protein SAMN05444123_11063 [Rhodopseudomonas pseudopalustris]
MLAQSSSRFMRYWNVFRLPLSREVTYNARNQVNFARNAGFLQSWIFGPDGASAGDLR